MTVFASLAQRRAAVAFVLITVVLDVLALGIVIPVLPKLIIAFEGGSEARAANMVGLFGTVWALMQLIFMPVMGALSDRFGRRPVILASNAGLGIDYMVMALAPDVWWLFVGRIVSGIVAATYSTANAYIADVTPPERRAGAFGLVGSAFGLGFVLGPALGGLLGEFDPRLPFWVAGGLSLLNTAYGWFVLPESLPPEKRRPFSVAAANPFGALRFLVSHGEVAWFASITAFANLAHGVLPSVAVLYASYRYGWGPQEMGLMLAAIGVGGMIVQGLLVKRFVAAFGERRAILTGLVCGVAGFAGYGLAPTGLWFVAAVPLMALWGLAGPANTALMSARVEPTAQGQLQGALGAVLGLTALISPGLYTQTFRYAVEHPAGSLPGAPFFVASGLLAAALAIAWIVSPARADVRPRAAE